MSHAEYILGLTKGEVTFLQVFTASDGAVLRCKAETYKDEEEVGKLDIIFRDEKRRQTKTLKKAGVTSQQLKEGIDKGDGAKQLSDYFIMHDGVIVGYGAKTAKNKINSLIQTYQFKMAGCVTLDLADMVNECGLPHGKNLRRVFGECLYQYGQFYRMEQNHFYCVVDRAYNMTLSYKKPREIVYCDTSIGRIYYDLEDDAWAMSKAEMERTGNRIENFDIEDIKRQLRERYEVRNMSELSKKLRASGSSFVRDAEGIQQIAI